MLWEFAGFLGSMPEAGTEKSMLLCNSCVELKESEASLAQTTDMSDGYAFILCYLIAFSKYN